MKHIKRASQAPTQLVLPSLGISQEKPKKKDSRQFYEKKKIKKKKSKGRYITKGKKRNKKSKK